MIFFEDEIVEITEVGELELIDIEVDGDHLFVANGILTHNSSIEANGEFDQSHTAGGISKINTSDNAIALYAPPAYKERGEFEFIMLKTRSSSGVGQRLKLAYDPTCMRITDPVLTMHDVDKPSSYEKLRTELKTPPTVDETPKPDEQIGDIYGRLNEMMAKKRQSTD